MDPNLLTKLRSPPGPSLDDACARCLVADIKGEATSSAWPALAQLSALEGEMYLKCIIYRLLSTASMYSHLRNDPSSLEMMCRNSVSRDLRNQSCCQTKVLATYYAIARDEIETSSLQSDSYIFVRLICADENKYPDAWLDPDPLIKARGVIRILSSIDDQSLSHLDDKRLPLLKRTILETQLTTLDFNCAQRLLTFLGRFEFSGPELSTWQLSQLASGLKSVNDLVATLACEAILSLNLKTHNRSEILNCLLSLTGRYEVFEPEHKCASSLIRKLIRQSASQDLDDIDILLTCQHLFMVRDLLTLWEWFHQTSSKQILNYAHLTIQENLIGHHSIPETICVMTHALTHASDQSINIWLALIVGKHTDPAFQPLIEMILSKMTQSELANSVRLFKSAPHSFKSILARYIDISAERLEQLRENPASCKEAIERLAFLHRRLSPAECSHIIANWTCCQTIGKNLANIDWDRLDWQVAASSSGEASHECFIEETQVEVEQVVSGISMKQNEFLTRLCQEDDKARLMITASTSPAAAAISKKAELENALDEFFREL